MINAKAFREVLPRVERVARHSIVFRRKKIGALCSIAEEAHLDAIGRKVIARYARQTFRRADQLRDHYDLSERTQSKLVLGAALIGLPIGAMLGLTLGVQYIGLLALWVGMALGCVIAALTPLFLYYTVAYCLVWKNLASERRKFLEGLEGA